ncbi:PRMT10 [Symbiodinium natans]|uniref:PRMT10 protein n=1 Tax=Symbiodinium natans TaxID=878477 RepID=A0A812RHF9_9DINO|nr:PRMT10 [Symbiodinium natans]
MAEARGLASAKRFWKAVSKGYPIIQRIPEQTSQERTAYSSDFLYTLTTDRLRMDAFRRAVARFRAHRVLEIGCGPWTPLVDLCLQSGASKVVAVEACATHAELARRRLKDAEAVQVINGRAADLPSEVLLAGLGGPPQLIVSELLGYTASEEGAPAILLDLQRRLGPTQVVPRAASSWMLPVRPLELSSWHCLKNWLLHGGWPSRLQPGLYDCRNFPESLELAAPQKWEEFDFTCAETLEAQLQQECHLSFTLPAGTEVGGVLLFMRADLCPGVDLDTRRDETSWNHYLLQLPPQRVGESGTLVVSVAVDARSEDVRYRFEVPVFDPDPAVPGLANKNMRMSNLE